MTAPATAAPAAAPQGTSAPAAPTTPAAAPSTSAPAATPPQTPAAPAAPPAKPPLSQEARAAIIENAKLKQELKKREESGKATAADLELLAKLRNPKTRYEVVKDLVPYEEYTQHILGTLGKNEPEPLKLPPEVAEKLKLVDDIEAERKASKEAAEREAQSKAFTEKVGHVTKYITDNAETLPMTAALGQGESFLRAFLAETEASGGVPPDDTEFASRYEKQLADTVEKQLTAIAASSSGKALLQRLLGAPAAPTTANPKPSEPTAGGARSPRAVTNGLSSETPPAKDPRALPEDELRKRAARLLG